MFTSLFHELFNNLLPVMVSAKFLMSGYIHCMNNMKWCSGEGFATEVNIICTAVLFGKLHTPLSLPTS